ncbi:S24/S26 family peptidase [Curtobacterium sp. RRHDQ66]|uniref:S24/S26 family peptidase n=1 Tax=Curtobacterium guangdongense TaxID=3413380 RepID=UPI003BF265D7
MVSIEVRGGRTPHDAVRDVVDWGRVVVATLARGIVATVLGLALWAAAPAVIGWHPTTVMTGSMEPRLAPGDVVVSRPVAQAEIRLGQILLADDPDQPGHLRMHRFVKAGPDDTLITKGDANPQRDSSAIERSAVHGVAFLRIPVIGAPIVWLRHGEWHKVVLLALALTAALFLCTIDGSLRRLASSSSGDGDGDGPAADDGLEARPTSAPSGAADGRSGRHVLSRRALRRRVRQVRRLRRAGGAAAVVLVAGSLGVLLPAQAVAAPFAKTTVSPTSSFATLTVPQATTLTCTPNGDGSVNIGFAYGGPTATSFSVVNGTTVLATGTTTPVKVVGSGILSLGQVYTVSVRVNFVGNWTSTSTSVTRIQTALVSTNLSCA